jgi:Na+/H+ antiporter NhaC
LKEGVKVGIVSLIPVIVVLILAFTTKRTLASLIIGSLLGAVIAYGMGFIGPWVDALYAAFSNGTFQWMTLVCGLFGGMIALFKKVNCLTSFSSLASKVASTKKRTYISELVLGLLMFQDDWVHTLVVGGVMKEVTDRNRIPREMLAFIAEATATSVCILIPASTWTAFFAGQMEGNGLCATGEGTGYLISTIPYMFFPILTMLLVILIVFGVVPAWGPLRKALKRADTTGELLPPGSPEEVNTMESELDTKKTSSYWNFIVPIVIMTVISIVTEEMLYGVLAGIVVCGLMYFPQKLLNYKEFCQAIWDGFVDMLPVCGIVFGAYVLSNINKALGLTDYCVGLITKFANPGLIPLVVFLLVSVLLYLAGNCWGMVAIVAPIIFPVAAAAGANMQLVAGALVSGAIVESTLCPYAAQILLGAGPNGLDNIEFSKSVTPILAVPFGLCVVGYAVAGLLM